MRSLHRTYTRACWNICTSTGTHTSEHTYTNGSNARLTARQNQAWNLKGFRFWRWLLFQVNLNSFFFSTREYHVFLTNYLLEFFSRAPSYKMLSLIPFICRFYFITWCKTLVVTSKSCFTVSLHSKWSSSGLTLSTFIYKAPPPELGGLDLKYLKYRGGVEWL